MEPSLVVAVAAFALSAVVAVWNAVTWISSGGRVRIGLVRGVLTSDGALMSGPFKTYEKWAKVSGSTMRELHREVAIIQVENRGRTAVTVFEPAIDTGWSWAKGRHRPYRRTVSPRLIHFDGAATEVKVRLESFDLATFIFDAGIVLENLHALDSSTKRTRRYRLRGSIRVGGKRWRRRSSRRSAFVVAVGQKSLVASPSAKTVAFRALARSKVSHDAVDFNYVKADLVGDLVASGEEVSFENLRKALEDAPTANADDSNPVVDALTVRRALVEHGIIDDTSGQSLCPHRGDGDS